MTSPRVFPVYDDPRCDISLPQEGLAQRHPTIIYGEQACCKGVGFFFNIHLRTYYLPIHGVETYKKEDAPLARRAHRDSGRFYPGRAGASQVLGPEQARSPGDLTRGGTEARLGWIESRPRSPLYASFQISTRLHLYCLPRPRVDTSPRQALSVIWCKTRSKLPPRNFRMRSSE